MAYVSIFPYTADRMALKSPYAPPQLWGYYTGSSSTRKLFMFILNAYPHSTCDVIGFACTHGSKEKKIRIVMPVKKRRD